MEKNVPMYLSEYCENCPYLEPEMKMMRAHSLTEDTLNFISVLCENRGKCERLYRHLKDNILKKGENNETD